MMLETDLVKYHRYKKLRADIDAELAKLSTRIKEAVATQGEHKTDNSKSLRVNGLEAVLQIKRSKPKIDPEKAYNYLARKDIWWRCSTTIVDETKIEQLYYEGALTDEDLRVMLADPSDPTPALHVHEVEEEMPEVQQGV